MREKEVDKTIGDTIYSLFQDLKKKKQRSKKCMLKKSRKNRNVILE